MKKGLVLALIVIAGMFLIWGCSEDAGAGHGHGEEITAFEIIDRRADEVVAYVHVDHWHGSLPVVVLGENISLDAYIEEDGEEEYLDGDHHALGVALAPGAEEGIVSFDLHGDHLHIKGEAEGETMVVFQFVHDGEVEYETPPIRVIVGHYHEDGHDHDHDHGEEPYEWSGIFAFEPGTYTMHFEESGDPSIEVVFMLESGDRDHDDHMAYHIWEHEMDPVDAGGSFEAEVNHGYLLTLNPDHTDFTFTITEAGDYLVYMEHFPSEFDLKILDSGGEEVVPTDIVEYEGHDHDH
jgi:hypothetical protein